MANFILPDCSFQAKAGGTTSERGGSFLFGPEYRIEPNDTGDSPKPTAP
jgi:hypothetical protein